MSNLSGKRLGQYEIGGVLGRGGMATVYRAHQASMDRDVAVKVIMGGLADNPDFIARFERESRLIARLQHPHILPVYDFGREEGLLFLVMRLVEGGSLDDRLKSGALPLPLAARMFTQIASAMSYAHRNGVIHRDMKPNNILLDEQENAYLMDFGIAKMMEGGVGSNLTATGVVMGTPAYMSPEQWRSEPVDARTDIYALGIMLYEMLTGHRPFSSDTPFGMMQKHLNERPPLPSLINGNVPPAVNEVLNKALAKNVEDRYQSADAMAQDLNAALAGTATQPPQPAPTGKSTGRQKTVPPQSATVPPSPPTVIPPNSPTLPPGAQPSGGGRLPLIIGGVIAVLLIAAIGGGLFITSQQGNGDATATQAANLAAANTRIAQAATGTAFALMPSATLTPTITQTPTLTIAASVTNTSVPVTATSTPLPPTLTPKLPTLTPLPPTPLPATTIAPTSAPLSVPTATAVQFSDFQSKATNITFRYPMGWEVNDTKIAENVIFITPRFDALKFGDDGSISGAPFIEIMVGDASQVGTEAMAQAKTPADAMAAYLGNATSNPREVAGSRFPTVAIRDPDTDPKVVSTIYLMMLGPNRFVLVFVDTPPELNQLWVERYALPLVRSVNHIITPTQVVVQATTPAEVTFVPPQKLKTLTFVALQIRMSVPDNWNVRLTRNGSKSFIFMAPPQNSTTIRNPDNFGGSINEIADEPFIVLQKKTRAELPNPGPNPALADALQNAFGVDVSDIAEVSGAPFPTVFGRITGQSKTLPINGYVVLSALDPDNFLLLTASAPRGHEDEYWQTVVQPMIASLAYPVGGTATPTN